MNILPNGTTTVVHPFGTVEMLHFHKTYEIHEINKTLFSSSDCFVNNRWDTVHSSSVHFCNLQDAINYIDKEVSK